MSATTGIEWTDATWNPVTGCTEVSLGCDHCYARTFAERWRGTPGHHFEHGFDVQLRLDKLMLPLSWRRPRRVFVNSMSDLFHQDVPEEYIARVFAVMGLAHQHIFQVLTKRHGRMRSLLSRADFVEAVQDAARDHVDLHRDDADARGSRGWPLPNVWLGVSVEDQQWADIRIPALLHTPAAVRFLSCEPLLAPVDLSAWLTRRIYYSTEEFLAALHSSFADEPPTPDWVIVGGESGAGARPMHPQWARTLRDQCTAAGVPFFFKQWGAWRPASVTDRPVRPSRCLEDPAPMVRVGKHAAGRVLDGRTWDEVVEVAR